MSPVPVAEPVLLHHFILVLAVWDVQGLGYKSMADCRVSLLKSCGVRTLDGKVLSCSWNSCVIASPATRNYQFPSPSPLHVSPNLSYESCHLDTEVTAASQDHTVTLLLTLILALTAALIWHARLPSLSRPYALTRDQASGTPPKRASAWLYTKFFTCSQRRFRVQGLRV